MAPTNFRRGAIAGGVSGLVLVLTWQRLSPKLASSIGIEAGLWVATLAAWGVFGLVFGFVFSGAYDGRKKLPMWSLFGWLGAGVLFCAFASLLGVNKSEAPLMLSAGVAGLVGGAGFGWGWGGQRGSLLIGLASLVAIPISTWLAQWTTINGVKWMLESGLRPNMVVIYVLSMSGFVAYGLLIGYLTSLCAETWEPDVPVRQRMRGLEEELAQHDSPRGRVSGVARSAAFAAPVAAAGAAATPLHETLGIRAAPTLEQAGGADALTFDDGDVALTPFEEGGGAALGSGYDDDDDMFLGQSGGRSMGGRNLHPDYAGESHTTTSDVGVGGFGASVSRPGPDRIEVDLQDAGDSSRSASNDESIEMSVDEEDEYGFLYDD